MGRISKDAVFSAKLRAQMQRLGLAVSDLSVLLEISEGTIYKWLRGAGCPHPLMRQAVLFRLDQEKDFRYSTKEIHAALKAYRHQ